MILSVLIVDDENVSREYIKGLINWEANGFSLVGEAQSAEEAMKILENKDIDIVLLDVYMPGDNGVVLSRWISHHYPSVAMIAISSYDNYDFVRGVLKNGAHDYILKHRLNKEILLSSLNALVRRIENKENSGYTSEMENAVESWLFKYGTDPYEGESGRLVVTTASVAWPNDPPDDIRTAITQGILSLLEENSSPEQLITAVYAPPNVFIICTLYKSETSEATIQGEQFLRNMRNKNNIKLIYNLEFVVIDPSLMMERGKIPKYIQKFMTGTKVSTMDHGATIHPNIALTIDQQKQLLSALSQRNEQAISVLITDIYNDIPDNNMGARVIITKELFEIIIKAAKEYQIKLDYFLKGEDLFKWAQNKKLPELRDGIIALYRQVIKEIKGHHDLSEHIRCANEYINNKFMHDIKLEDVAKHIGVSSSYLSRLYRQELEMTFVEYINGVRINAAKAFLDSGMPIKNVVTACGFQRYNYFFKVFKDHEGITPKQYLKREG